MPSLSDFSLQFIQQQPWLTALLAIGIVGLAWWSYRKTTPSLAALVRVLLFSARAIVIVVIGLLLLQPVLGFTRQQERQPRVALLLDRSGSMQRVEAGRTRQSRVDSMLSSATFSSLSDRVELSRTYFAGNSSSSETDLDTSSTALGDALRTVSQTETKPDHILLLTDGRTNAGEDASVGSAQLPPVIAVDLALLGSTADLWIDQVQVNPVGFLGQPMKLSVRIGKQGAITLPAGDSLHLVVRDGSHELGSIRLKVDSGSGQYLDGELTVTPTELGRRLWDVSVASVDGELSALNNRKSVAVNILKSRLSVLLVAAHPDLEIGFLRRTLASQDKYEVTMLTTGQKSGNLGKVSVPMSQWSRFDAIVLYDPTGSELFRYQETIEKIAATKLVGVWVMLGSRFASESMPSSLRAFLPAYPAGSRARVLNQEFNAVPTEAQLFHPTVRLAEQRSEIREHWSELPPFQQLILCDSVSAQGTVTLSTDPVRGLSAPVFVTKRVGQGKLLQSNAQSFWRFDFGRTNLGKVTGDYSRLMLGIIDWLTLPDEGDPIRFSPERELFTRGEKVRFSGTAFDPGLRPLEHIGGRVVLTPSDSGKEKEVDQPILGMPDGTLSTEFASLRPGDYRYAATIEQEGAALKKFIGQIRVEPFSAEEYDQSGNPALLTSIAKGSGGVYLTANQFDQITAAIPVAKIAERSSGEYALWGKSWPLFLILGLLAAEWVARKLLNLL